MSSALSKAIKFADEIEAFPLGNCGPSDDPDKQTAYLYGFRDLAKRFIAAAKRIGDPDLSEQLSNLDTSPEFITEAYDLRAELFGIIDYLREAAENPKYQEEARNNSAFLNADVLLELKSISPDKYDIKKLVAFCEELNDSYGRANYLSCILLIRAVMNHVPPIFGHNSFSQVVATSGRSVKAVLSHLEDQARPIADLHTHILIRKKEQLPSKHQIEPYKPSFEILIQEIIAKLHEQKG